MNHFGRLIRYFTQKYTKQSVEFQHFLFRLIDLQKYNEASEVLGLNVKTI